MKINWWYLKRFFKRPLYDARWLGAYLPVGATRWKHDYIKGYKKLFKIIFK